MTQLPHPDNLRPLAHRILSPGQYTAWELREGGMSLRAIALHLDLSLTTISDRIRRADQKLARHLKEHHANVHP